MNKGYSYFLQKKTRTMNLSIVSVCFLVITVVQAVDKFNCPAAEVDNFDVVTARIVSLSEHQRPFPQSKSDIEAFCR